jgi:Putative peptidoglycan binding domain
LLLLIDKEVMEFNAAQRAAVGERLSRERQEGVYQDATTEVVTAFQRQHEVNVTGEPGDVDEPTAEPWTVV